MTHNLQLKYKALLTDLDNTLYDFAIAQESACQAVIKTIGCGTCQDLITAFIFSPTGVESHATIVEYLNKQGIFDEQRLLHACNVYEETKAGSLVLYPGVLETLQTIKKSGIRIGAITNATSDNAIKRLIGFGIYDLISIMITPDICGYRKPSAKFFQRGAEEIGIPIINICVLGDNLINDIAPAQLLGMYAVHARYGDRLPTKFAGDTIPDEVIDSFSDILKILGLKYV